MKKEPQKCCNSLDSISESDYTIPLLLIDDNSFDNFINRKLFELYGVFDITVFSSAYLALEHLSVTNMKYHYIFVDLIMPVMDGFTFIEHFNNLLLNQKQGKLVILSASTCPKNHLKADNLNIKYIEKPLAVDKLLFMKNEK